MESGETIMIIATLTNPFFPFNQTITGKGLNSSQKYILSSIKQTDPEKADLLEKQIDDANQLITQLRICKKNISKSAKGTAASKVQQIKDQIKMLMLMGGDPKMIAKKIAQLSRELAAAVREYASSSGNNSIDAGNAEAAGVSNDNPATTLQNSDSSESMSSALSTATSSSEAASIGEKGVCREVPAGINQQSQENTEQSKSTGQDMRSLLPQSSKDFWNKEFDLASRRLPADDDRAFTWEVRKLIAQLKFLARQQKQRLQQAGKSSTDNVFTEINQSLAETEKSISAINSPFISVSA